MFHIPAHKNLTNPPCQLRQYRIHARYIGQLGFSDREFPYEFPDRQSAEAEAVRLNSKPYVPYFFTVVPA